MNPIAIFFIVFFLASQGSTLYIFTHSISGDPTPLVLLISAIFAGMSAYGEIEWTNSHKNREPNK